MSIATKFLPLIWKSWRARARQIFYMCFRNVLKYSDFIFYVATIKNNKFNVNLRFCNKYRPISEACRRTRAGCAPKILWKIFAKIIYLKVCKFSFSQKHTGIQVPKKRGQFLSKVCAHITFWYHILNVSKQTRHFERLVLIFEGNQFLSYGSA